MEPTDHPRSDSPKAGRARNSDLSKILLERRRKDRPSNRIPRRAPGALIPLSYAQEQIWFLEQLAPGGAAYHIARSFALEGPLDPAALARSLGAVVTRHEALRTSFAIVAGQSAGQPAGQPVQAVAAELALAIPVLDLRAVPEPAREEEARRLEREEVLRPFDLARGPVLRLTLLRLADERSVLLLTLHHIAADGWSLGILLRELGALYAGETLPPLPLQYADFALWQRERLAGSVLEKLLAFWRTQLEGAPPVLALPTDRPRPPVQSFRGAGCRRLLPLPLAARLRSFGEAERTTPFMALLAAFQALLLRHTGQEDLVLGSPVAGRSRSELEGLIGLFINMLVLRTSLASDPGFRELVGRVREVVLSAYAHQEMPFEKLVTELSPERDLGHAPVFQVIFTLQSATWERLDLPGVALAPREIKREETKADLTFAIHETGDGLALALQYDRDLFDGTTMARLAAQYEELLSAALAYPDRPVSGLPALLPAERHQVFHEWNDTAAAYGPAACLHELIARQAARTPDAPALVFEGEGLTYAEADRRANHLAWRLRELGVGPEVRVAVQVARSLELPLALLAVLKAGGAYVPLDPSYPQERLDYMLADSRAAVRLTRERVLELMGESDEAPDSRVQPENLAYVIYTSGSTGRPKGAMNSHRGIVNRLQWMQSAYGLDASDRVLQKTPASFDVSVWELFWPLLTGACLVVAKPGGHQDSAYLVDLIRRERVTTMHFVPSMLQVFVEQRGVEECASLKRVICSGEALPADLVRRYFEKLGSELHNLYGPTEAAVDVTYQACRREDRIVPIGRPIANLSIHVVDRSLRATPLGVPGELLIGGVGVGRGYLGRPELTAERFIPGEGGRRLYRTGDLARHLGDGRIEYLGRIDHQVKVRGFRIELQEIEAALMAEPEVREAAVVVREEAGDRRLVAYIVGTDAGLKERLRGRLPEYMVPAAIVALEALPLSPSGKVDRGALAKLGVLWASAPEQGHVAPRTALEGELAGMWSSSLGLEKIGVHDNFFELGGNSITGAVLINRLQERLGEVVQVAAIFDAPTVAGLAAYLGSRSPQAVERIWGPASLPGVAAEAGAAAFGELMEPITPAQWDGASPPPPLPLSFAQERLWFLDQLEPGNPFYNVPSALRLAGTLDVAALQRSFDEVVRRHRVLRTRFALVAGAPAQVAAPELRVPLPVVDLAGLPAASRETETRHLANAEARRPFDLSRVPLLRTTLLRLGKEEHALLLSMHHIVSDGWSMGILFQELASLYEQSPLPELPIQYADFAVWQRSRLAGEALEQELAWWRERLAGAPALLELPTDRPRPPIQSFRGGRIELALPRSAEVAALSRRSGTTLFMTLLAAFDALLSRLTGQLDVVVGSPIAGRNRTELEGLIGFFVNTLVLRTDLSGDPGFAGILERVRQATIGAYTHQELPFEKLVGELAPVRTLAHAPLFQVMLVLQNLPRRELRLGGALAGVMPAEERTAKFDLTLSLVERGGGLAGAFHFNSDLFDAATVARFADHFRTLVEGAVADPAARLSDLPLLSAAARAQLLREWNDTARGIAGIAGTGGFRSLPERIAEQAARTPGAVAVLCGGESLTYAELDRRANRLAWHLRDLGVGPEVRVAISMERSPDLLVALLGVLKAGGAYVPVDPSYPEERRAFMLADSGAAMVLDGGFPSGGPEGEVEEPPPLALAPENLVYVLYTSGSTGRPKGVQVPHGALVNLLSSVRREPGLDGTDTVLAVTTLSFDIAATELFLPLLVGARVVLAGREDARDGARLAALAEGATLLQGTPAGWRMLLDSGWKGNGRLRALTAGEPLSRDLADRLLEETAELWNLYGPTEATVYCTAERVLPGRISIGRPLANYRVHVLDHLGPAPVGVTGEIAVGGAGLARGYAGRSDLTAERFVPDPFGRGERLYRTGDLGRLLPDGRVDVLGRIDHQVKVRGFRIELQEVEAALVRHPGVREAVALASDGRLVAFLVAEAGATPAAVRAFAGGILPEHMVPALVVPLPAFPLTSNGKVDRKALAVLSTPVFSRETEASRSPIEEVAAGIWREVLKVSAVGIEDDFFDLGGHSLLVTQVVSRARQAFGVDLAVRSLFEAKTLAAWAGQVESALRAGRGTVAPIGPAAWDGRSPLPLSFAQERLWFLDQLEPGSPFYNIPAAIRLEGRLDPAALREAFDGIVRRHRTLRTRFAAVQGEPAQVVEPELSLPLPVVDLSGLPPAAREPEARQLANAEARRPFSLYRVPLLRTTLLRLGEEEHTLLLCMHHIVSDGWSMGVLFQELAALYEGSPLPELPVQYADFAVWQRAWLAGEALEQELAWWRERLAGAPALLELPTDRPRPPVQSFRGGKIEVALPRPADLGALARRSGATLFMTLLAAFGALLSRLTGQPDVVVGSPVAGRERTELEGLIGFFVNTLVLRTDLSGDPGFAQILERVRQATIGAYTHQELPFEKLVGELAPARTLAHSPLFQVMLVLQNVPWRELRIGELALTQLGVEAGTSKFDLRLALTEREDVLLGSVLYNRDLFDRSTAARFTAGFGRLLAGALADPGAPLSELPLLDEAERHQLVVEWNDTRAGFRRGTCLHGLIARQAARTPDAPALVFEGESLAYAELERRSNHLAWRLRELGVGPEVRVAVEVERSLELPLALLAVLKAGGAYVPLDPSYPRERLDYMLEDSRAAVHLNRERVLGLMGESDSAPDSGVQPENLAYVIYTSGSTGRPKGAMNSHRGIVNRLQWMQSAYGLDASDRVLQKTPASFDVSVWEFFWPLLTGACLVVARPGGHQDSAYLVDLIRRQGVTTLHFVPSMLQVFVEQPGVEQCTSLKRVICSGEALPADLVRRYFEKSRAELHNLYGPTEAAVDVTFWACRREDRAVPIGRPIANLSIQIVDRAFRPAPLGVPGELLIGGVGVGRGYLYRPDLTAERFVPGPSGERLYRTGDLARFLGDGRIEYLGRADHQVKVRGFRIELQEIEAALMAEPEVREAAVVVRHEASDQAGDRRLVAYVVGTEADLRERLRARLPEYMVPAAISFLDALPLSPSGKVDRGALSKLGVLWSRAPEQVAPRTALEAELARMWSPSPGIDSVGVHDSFFELGGNSITGAILINRLQERLGEIVHVVAIFDQPTVAGFAAWLGSQYPEAVERIWGPGSLPGGAGRGRRRVLGTAEAAAFRELIEPLAPAVSSGRNPRAVFLLSPPRSGSTLLRVMLAGHPRLFAPPELELLSFNTMAERRAAFSGRDSFWLEGAIRAVMEIQGEGPHAAHAADTAREWIEQSEQEGWTTQRFYREMQELLDGRMLVDKTPSYALDPSVLQRAEESFEEPLYIHLLRHPYGMVSSFEEAKLDQVFFRRPHSYARRELAELVWRVSHENVTAFLAGIPAERHHAVFFEDLVREPEETLRDLCGFLGLDFDPAMAAPYQDKGRRMTDGLHAESRMLGDVKFHQHQGVEASAAERWRERYREDFLAPETWAVAAAFSYGERPSHAFQPIEPAEWDGVSPLPLSFAQERLWFLDQLEPGSAFYNIPVAVRLDGALDVAALQRSFEEIVRRHRVLRTRFAVVEGAPVQLVAPEPSLPLPVVDLAGLPEALRETETRRLADAEARLPFDLGQGPLIRTTLLRLGSEAHALLLSMHHIVSDGWSMGVLLQELSQPSSLPELPIQYADYAVWQRARLSGETLEAELAWWRERLAGAPALLELPTDRPRPAVQRFRGGKIEVALPRSAEIAAFSRRSGATLFMALLAAFDALLARLTGQRDLVVGSPVAGRGRAELENLIGFFINTLVLRADLSGDPGFARILERVRESAVGAYAHQELPFEKLVGELAPVRTLAHAPLFQVMLMLQNAPRRGLRIGDARASAFAAEGATAKFDLTLSLAERGDGLAGAFEYNSDLFDAATVARFAEGFRILVEGSMADPGARLSDLPLLSAAGRAQLLREWNDTAADPGGFRSLPDRIAGQAARTPEAVAVLCGGASLTYAELNRRANRLAWHLRSLGVVPETRVAIAMERSPDLLVALLGVLKAGGAYVPIDPSYPEERRAWMLADSGAAVVLDGSLTEGEAEAPPPLALAPGNLAYVLYTSGSTGRPKGVQVPHGALVSFLDSMRREPGLDEEDTLLAVTTLSFDIAGLELFLPLLVGARVVLAGREEAQDAARLAALIESATVLQATPATWQMLLDSGWQGSPRLRALCGGEALPRDLADRLLPRIAALWNLYGPTEATIWCSAERVLPGEGRISIGRPIANTRLHVLDADLGLAPLGAVGELAIGGEGLARGYAGRGDLTAERFVPDPFGSFGQGERLYRTGDLARALPDGRLEVLGRIDHQVKVRGFRIELQEIEAALARHPDVREAVVLATDGRLAAFVVANAGREADPAAVRSSVREILPEYMVPSLVVALPSFPLTPNGKVDRRALPAPALPPGDEGAFVPPSTEMEELVARVWAQVLGIERVGAHDRFFDIGGHSLLATQVVSRLRRELGLEIPLRTLFERPTLAGFSYALEDLLLEGSV